MRLFTAALQQMRAEISLAGAVLQGQGAVPDLEALSNTLVFHVMRRGRAAALVETTGVEEDQEAVIPDIYFLVVPALVA